MAMMARGLTVTKGSYGREMQKQKWDEVSLVYLIASSGPIKIWLPKRKGGAALLGTQ